MAATPSIKIMKFGGQFRGAQKQWSNRYHFDGGDPADSAHWAALEAAIIAQEKTCYGGGVTITEVLGYNAGSDVPVYEHTNAVVGTYAGTGVAQWLEMCGLIRWSTDQRTSKNHPIYLFSYMHSIYTPSGGRVDTLDTAYRTALQNYAAAWVAGFSDGTVTHHRAGPNGAVGLGSYVDPLARNHSFPL